MEIASSPFLQPAVAGARIMMERKHIPLRRIFLVPAVLAALSAAGLVSALFGDGAWDVMSWLALATPVAIAMYFAGRARVSS
jgi:hypothetical protein